MSGIITLITDFGAGSSYVAQLKGVLLGAAPSLRVVDVSHSVAPQNIREAALLLRSTGFAFPRGTVHVVVVDPGVGTSRRGIAVSTSGMFFVGPDNGVLGVALERPDATVVHLDNPAFFRAPVSPTFHGRDIFAPVAAELSSGLPLAELGSPLEAPVLGALPRCTLREGVVHGEVLGADSFGNLLTNVAGGGLDPTRPVLLDGGAIPWCATYGAAPLDTVVALIGSDGYVEVAVRDGSALENLGAAILGRTVCAPCKE